MFGENFWVAFGLTLFAGLSTGIGGLIAFLAKSTNRRFLSLSLGFSAGVMIYVSLVEIFFKAKESLIAQLGEHMGNWVVVLSFFGGIFLIAIIDRLIPSYENPHEIRDYQSDHLSEEDVKKFKLHKMGIFVALAITIHNFPEGLATFIAALKDPYLGIPIAIAIGIHNIPEGISVSVPIYQACQDRKKALAYSFVSGLAEPLGALVGFFLLRQFLNDTMLGVVFASVAGIMVYISLDELLPAAREYGEHHLSIMGLIVGMMVMALSLLLLI